MCANAVKSNDTGARLSASVDNFRREGYRNHTRPTVPYRRLYGHEELVEHLETDVILGHRPHLPLSAPFQRDGVLV